MRILLDEDLPRRLGTLLAGHECSTVPRSGWAGTKNGGLLALAAAKFDVLMTMDQNLEFQQNLATLPIAVWVVKAPSNRMVHLVQPVPAILKELNHLRPKATEYIAQSRCPTAIEASKQRVLRLDPLTVGPLDADRSRRQADP